MSNGTLRKKVRVKADMGAVILAIESQTFCVSLRKDGKTEKREGREPASFLKHIKKAEVSWVDYVTTNIMAEAEVVGESLGFSRSLINSLLKNEEEGDYIDNDTELGILIPAIIVDKFEVEVRPLLILIKKGLVVTLHGTKVRRFFHLRRYAETLMKKINRDEPLVDKTTRILARIIDENNSRNFEHLREIEENGDKLSEMLSDPKTSRDIIGPEIYKMKHALVVYLGALWRTLDVLNSLRYGDPELLTDDDKVLNQLGLLSAEVSTHINLAEHLSDVLASGMEVLQSIYNNQLQLLNNKLAMVVTYLTIIGTAVLVPNTIATVTGNPIYGLTPADAGWYTALIVASTVVAIIVSWIWVKRLGWVPKKPDED